MAVALGGGTSLSDELQSVQERDCPRRRYLILGIETQIFG
jgi:hypothetical protein